jgi:hypothetical protein
MAVGLEALGFSISADSSLHSGVYAEKGCWKFFQRQQMVGGRQWRQWLEETSRTLVRLDGYKKTRGKMFEIKKISTKDSKYKYTTIKMVPNFQEHTTRIVIVQVSIEPSSSTGMLDKRTRENNKNYQYY